MAAHERNGILPDYSRKLLKGFNVLFGYTIAPFVE